jgi:hydroxyacylglutathione hydrolase
MIIEQHYLACLAQASYLLGDEKSRTAVIVDPRRDVDVYIDHAKELGLEIRHVILTHFHADFVAGHLELAKRCGATLYLGSQAKAEFEFHGLEDGERLEFGDMRIQVMHTPGHTPESICLLVFDLAKDATHPEALLTGDTLFVGDVGRPDLLASVGFTKEQLAGQLYDSLHEKILPLADDVRVYPGHGAGSSCGRKLGDDPYTTIGAQRRDNYALAIAEKDEFIRVVGSDQPVAPRYFIYDATLNKKQRPLLEDTLKEALQPLTPEVFLAKREAGARVLDTRDAYAFAEQQLVDSVQLSLDGPYAGTAGSLFDPDEDVLLITAPGTERESALRLGRIGYDRVHGYLDGGIGALGGHEVLLRSTERLLPFEFAEFLEGNPGALIVDVRTKAEVAERSLEAENIHIPLEHLPDRLDEVPDTNPLLTVCVFGFRSSIAASLLRAAGRTRVVDLADGLDTVE